MPNRADVMTVREMIDAAVVFEDCNPVVDFKMIEAVLYIIGRHMNILERHVMVTAKNRLKVKKTISVTEIKIHAMTMKKKKGAGKKKSRKKRPDEPSDTEVSEDLKKKTKSIKKEKGLIGSAPSDTSQDQNRKTKSGSKSRSRSQSKRGKHSIGLEPSDTSQDQHKKKKYRSTPRSRSHSRKHKDYMRSDPSDTSDDQTKKRRKSRSRSRSKSQSKKRKHFRDAHSTTVFTSKERKRKEAAKRKAGSKRRKPRGDEDDDSMEVLREKLLVVSRSTTETSSDHRGSIVTQEQFDSMVTDIRQLQAKFGMKDMFADGGAPWANLHKATSLTDPRAALNMAARLDASEKKTIDMLTVMTKFAKQIPGINVEKAFDARYLPQPKLEPASEQTKTYPTTSPSAGMEFFVEEDYGMGEAELEEEEDDRVTKEQLKDGLRHLRTDLHRFVPAETTHITTTAKRASQIFQQTEPRLMEAQQIKSKFIKMQVLADAFANKVTLVDNTLTSQMGDCQENLSQMQFDLETTLERIDDISAHPKEDPNAVAAIKEDFTILQHHIDQANSKQNALAESHTYNAADLKMLWRKVEMLQKNKTTRAEVLEALKGKASINDLNGLLAKEQFYAVIGFLQQHIVTMKEQISSGELVWQKLIDEVALNLYDRANHIQVATLIHSIRTCLAKMNGKLDKMLDIVGKYPVNIFKKKIDRGDNCLCCGTPANTKLSDEYMEIAKRLITLPVEESRKVQESEIKHPCIPGLPLPHPLDPRALFCERYCGGTSIGDTEVSLPSSFAMDILDINPVKASHTKNQVYVEEIKKRCTPCTHSEETLYK